MVKLLILFKQPHNEADFEAHYVNNLALLEQLPGIIRRQANMVLGSPTGKSTYYRMLELYFEDFDALDAALTSEAGIAAGSQLMQTVGDLVELVFVDVFEDNAPLNNN